MKRLIFTLTLGFLVLFSSGQSRAFTTRDSLNAYCDMVMQSFKDGKFSKGVQLFKRNSVMDSITVNNIAKTMDEQMVAILPVYGKCAGYELIGEKEIKNSLALRRYLLKFEKYFLSFDFVLYNNGSGWTVSNFNYKDEPKALFNEN
jgi:hypothetical protein